MPAIHAVRRDRLRALLAAGGLDGLLVTRLVNLDYLTGLTSSHAALLVTATGATLATDGRYRLQAGRVAPDVDVVINRAVEATLVEQARDHELGRVGFEAHDVTVELHESLREIRPLEPAGRLVESLRATKDSAELALLRAACAAADAVFADLVAGPFSGRSEREIASSLEAGMRTHGADGPSFESIVASGPNSALPHHRPSGKTVEAGELVVIDFGALVGGYRSDMTRTLVVGPATAWQRDLYALVSSAQRVGCAQLQPGAEVRTVDAAARAVIADAGHGEHYPHGLGHGVGLEIHEAPAIGPNGSGTLLPGMSVTVEPGVYLPGRGGIRIEDTLVVTDGEPELLTHTRKDLLVL